jgi:hypothetical protein
MRREPSLTLQGALKILGRHEPRLIGKLNKLLGGVILLSGAGAGLAAVSGPALGPLAMFAAVWGWTEQKNEALGLVRAAINALSDKLAGTAGYERRQLIAAAHTTIVLAAFFESFREHVGNESYELLQITDDEKEMLLTGRLRRPGESMFEILYTAEVPAPSPSQGFEENVREVYWWLGNFANVLDEFIAGLSAGESLQVDWRSVHDGAVERYRSHFLSLAAKVPEYMIWTLLGEDAATRSAIGKLRADMIQALDGSREALARVESMLALGTAVTVAADGMDLCATMARANRGILEQPILPADAERYGPDLEFPAVGRIYINPRYRIAEVGQYTRPADEDWWEAQASRDNFDLMLARYITAPDSTRLPMLLLGHPGAGKSMLTKVFAARLPSSGYTVVRVPLRKVGANAPLLDQIQQGLDLATNRRVDWWRLSEQSAGTIRVVVLDGLDELLQASNSDRSGYLQEVMEFQRLEAEQERPVIVVVTSRTVVADRVDIPRRTTVVKLDTFDKSDIAEWLSRWHEANGAAIASGKVRALQLSAALQHPDLAHQPLLLLMLALYAADPTLPPLDAGLSTADLYQRLLEGFARREVVKSIGHNTRDSDLDQRVQDHLDRLAVAALAMFNRGRQDISEEEVGADLGALDEKLMGRSRPAEAGQRIIGEFFFVHAAEAHPLSALNEAGSIHPSRTSGRQVPYRRYEFLHATFGEYLVSSRVMTELVEVAEKAFAGRRGLTDPDDDMLFALLSHQPLAGRRSTLTFAKEICSILSDSERSRVLEVLEILIGSYRYRHGSGRYAGYRPSLPDLVRQLAHYSANLVALRTTLEREDGSVPLTKLLHAPSDTEQLWRSIVMLWRSGLDADGLQAMLGTIHLTSDPVGVTAADPRPRAETYEFDGKGEQAALEVLVARLLGDRDMENRLRYGSAIHDGYVFSYYDNWRYVMASWLIAAIAGLKIGTVITKPPPGTSDEDIVFVAALIFRYLRIGHIRHDSKEAIIDVLFAMPRVFPLDGYALAAAVISGPYLLEKVPELKDAKTYGSAYELIRAAGSPDLIKSIKGGKSARKSSPYSQEVKEILLESQSNFAIMPRPVSPPQPLSRGEADEWL